MPALARLEQLLDGLEISSWFSGRFDAGDAILTVNPGQGGLEAQDWTEMLYRMYSRYAEGKGWKVRDLDVVPGADGDGPGQGDDPDRGPQRLRHADERGGRAPPRAHQPHRRQEAPPHDLRRRGGAARAARRHRGRPQPRRRARRRVPLERPRRPVRQHDRLGRAPDAHPHGHRRHLPEREEPATEQGGGVQGAARQALRARAPEARGGAGELCVASAWRTRSAARSATTCSTPTRW